MLGVCPLTEDEGEGVCVGVYVYVCGQMKYGSSLPESGVALGVSVFPVRARLC